MSDDDLDDEVAAAAEKRGLGEDKPDDFEPASIENPHHGETKECFLCGKEVWDSRLPHHLRNDCDAEEATE